MKKSEIWIVLACAILVTWWAVRPVAETAQAQSGVNILKNPGFEEAGDGIPNWSIESKTAGQGRISVTRDQKTGGAAALALSPNRQNKAGGEGDGPLRVAQGFPGGAFRGKRIYLSGHLRAESGATAIFSAVALRRGGGAAVVELRRESSQEGWAVLTDILQLSDADNVALLIVGCSVEGTSGTAYFDDLYAGTNPPPAPAAQGSQPARGANASVSNEASVEIDFGRDIRPIPRELYGANLEWIWDGNGMWDAKNQALNRQVLELVQELRPALLRFPGGVFSNFYHWKDGVGPVGSRKEASHILGEPKSRMLLGTDEALQVAKSAGGRLLITANISTASPEEAAEWVRYVNRDPGQRVDYWELGNELYIRDGSPPSKITGLTPSQYADKFQKYARVMRAADPKIKLGAVTDDNYGRTIPHADKDWTGDVLRRLSDQVDFLSIHNGYAPALASDQGWDVKTVYSAMLAAPKLIANHLDRLSSRINREFPKAGGIQFAITEWGPLFQGNPQDRFVDHVKTLASALYVASAMNVFLRSERTTIATVFKLIDPLFAGIIAHRDNGYAATAPYYALQLYTRHFGDVLIGSDVKSPTYNSVSVGWVDAVQGVPYIDAVASRSANRRKLFLLVVNRHLTQDIRTTVKLNGFRPFGQASTLTLNGTAIDANTGTRPLAIPGVTWREQAQDARFSSGGPGEVRLIESKTSVSNEFAYLSPAHSVTSFEITAR